MLLTGTAALVYCLTTDVEPDRSGAVLAVEVDREAMSATALAAGLAGHDEAARPLFEKWWARMTHGRPVGQARQARVHDVLTEILRKAA